MHIVLSTVGTEGDVRPFVAIARGLVAAGHRCTVATHTDYEGFVARHGLGYRPIGQTFKRIVESEPGRRWIDSSDSLFRYVRATRETFLPLILPWATDAYEASLDADLVLAHPFSLGATFAAEKRGRPSAIISLVPWVPSGELEPVFFPKAPSWRWLRRSLTGLSTRSVSGLMIPPFNELRARVGLPPIKAPNLVTFALDHRVAFLHAYSPHITPQPSDWPELSYTTGTCFLDDDDNPTSSTPWSPPAELVALLGRGEAPIYVGFGSMTGRDPQELCDLAIAAVRRSGERAVLVTGWGGAHVESDDVFVTDHVSHAWLLPRVKAVVHHGGIGTTAAGLRAGKPTQVVAFFGDQPYWGHRVKELGCGPAPLLKRKLTEASLAEAIRETVSTSSYEVSARRVAAELAREDGVANAVARILSLAR